MATRYTDIPTLVHRLLWLAFVACVALAGWLAFNARQVNARRERDALTGLRAQAKAAADHIEAAFREAARLGDGLARDLADGTLGFANIEARLKTEFKDRDALDGLAVTFEPFAYDPKQRLYQEYVSRKPDGSLATLKGASYDYTLPPSKDPAAPKTEWYHTPRANGPTWNEPFLATGAGKYLVEYGRPFFRRGAPDKPAGVVTVDFSLRDIREMMARLDLGATGYCVAFTAVGTYFAHPDARKVVKASVFDGGADGEVPEAARRALAGTANDLEDVDAETGEALWVFFEPIRATGGAVGLIAKRDEFAGPSRQALRQRVGVALVAAAALVLALALMVRVESGTTLALWSVSLGFSAACAGVIVLTWAFAWQFREAGGLAVTGRITVDRYLDRYAATRTRAERPLQVPTGLQITSVKFPDATSVTFTGHVWQRYPANLPKEFARGFTLPQRIDPEETVQEVERVAQGDDEVIVWFVTTTVQQPYDPTRFPFDPRAVTIRLLPAELNADVVLTPDLGAYPQINPQALPGLGPDVRVNNWQLRRSYFGYRLAAPAATLGLPNRAERASVPELAFTVEARRHFLGPFIAYLVPAVVASGLAFALLAGVRAKGGRPELVASLSYVAALFFVIVLAHTALRDAVAAVGITYLEHFFILLYFLVAFVVVDAFLLAHSPETWLARRRGNLVPKLLYWPTYAGVLLLSTLAVFLT